MGDDKLESAEIDIYKEATISSISSFIGTIISLALVVVVTYYLSVEEVGTFFFYATFVFFLAQVPKGFGLAVRKRVSSVSKNKSSYYFSGFLMLLLYIVVSIIGLILFEPVLETYTEISVESSELILTGFVASSKGFNTYSTKYYAGCGFPAKSENIRNYLGRGSQVLLILFLLQFANSTVTLALLGYGLGPFISFIAVIFLSPLKYESPNIKKVKSIIKFSRWSIPNSLLNSTYQQFDTIILSIMVGSVAVGFYNSSVRLSSFGFAFAYGIATASNVKISGLYEVGDDITNIVRSTTNASTILVYPTLIIAILHSETILNFSFGSDYTDAKYYLIAIIAYQVLQAYRLQFESVLNGVDKPEHITNASIVAVVFNVLTAPILVIYIGGIGAVVSTFISEIFRHVVFQYQIKKQIKCYIITRSMIYQPCIAGLILIILYIPNALISMSSIWIVIIDTVIATTAFLTYMYKTSDGAERMINSTIEYLI